MSSVIASEVWVDDVLRRWKIASAYFIEAYLLTTLYLLYGTVRYYHVIVLAPIFIILKLPRNLHEIIQCLYLHQNIREWDLLQFFSSTVVLLRVPMRELFGVVSGTYC